MSHPCKVISVFLCAMLLSIMLPSFLPCARAQDTTSPEISDMTEGTPVVGEPFTIKVHVTDDISLFRVQFYVFFTYYRGSSPISNIMQYASDYPSGTADFQTTAEVPLNATEMRFTVIATDTSSNVKVTDTLSYPIKDNIAPVAACALSHTIDMGDSLALNGSASSDNVGIANYSWTISYNGSAVHLYGGAPTFLFKLAGNHMGNLVVKDPWGNSNTRAFQVIVIDSENPMADAGIALFVMQGNQASFDGTGSRDNLVITNYSWQFVYNGTQHLLYGASPTFLFWTPGTYEVFLTVEDAAGNSDMASITVQVLRAESEDSGISWWIYALVIMVIAIVVTAIIILRM